MERLRTLFDVIADEAEHDPRFAARIASVMDATAATVGQATDGPRRRNRRPPGAIDPFIVYTEGEDALRQRLEELNIEQLKDIISEHGMDRAKLASKWKTKDRLVSHIVTTVREGANKGHAFRRTP